MPELIRPSTVLPAKRSLITIKTSDGLNLIGEVATPEGEITGSLLMLHPNPSGGGMMDSHIYKKAANRLPAMAGIQIIRFNTRGTTSEAGKSDGEFDQGISEKLDVLAALDYCFDQLKVKELYVIGWSFGTELALKYATDKRFHPGFMLISIQSTVGVNRYILPFEDVTYISSFWSTPKEVIGPAAVTNN